MLFSLLSLRTLTPVAPITDNDPVPVMFTLPSEQVIALLLSELTLLTPTALMFNTFPWLYIPPFILSLPFIVASSNIKVLEYGSYFTEPYTELILDKSL